MKEPVNKNNQSKTRNYKVGIWIVIILLVLSGVIYYMLTQHDAAKNGKIMNVDSGQLISKTKVNGDTANLSIPDGETPNKVSPQNSILDTLAGTWVGSAYQSDIRESWTISFDNKNGNYEIKYPSIGCGGGWKLTNKNKSSWTFQETLRYGKDSCTNYGFIVLKYVNGSKLKYSYYYPDMSILSAEGFLDKK